MDSSGEHAGRGSTHGARGARLRRPTGLRSPELLFLLLPPLAAERSGRGGDLACRVRRFIGGGAGGGWDGGFGVVPRSTLSSPSFAKTGRLGQLPRLLRQLLGLLRLVLLGRRRGARSRRSMVMNQSVMVV